MKEDIFKKTEEPKVEIEAKVEKKVEDPEEKILEKAIKETAKIEVSKPYQVTVARLNIRKGPSDRDDILRTVASGTKVTVDTSGTRGAWSKITAPVEGYVMTQFIAPVK